MPKLNPPDPIDFHRPKWTEWKSRFTRYRVASKLTEDSGEGQVATLIYSMGNDAENIFASFSFQEKAHKQDYQIVLQKFEEFCTKKKRNLRAF